MTCTEINTNPQEEDNRDPRPLLPLIILRLSDEDSWRGSLSLIQKNTLATQAFKVKDNASTQEVILFVGETQQESAITSLISKAKSSGWDLQLKNFPSQWQEAKILMYWGLGTYEFTRYKKPKEAIPTLYGTCEQSKVEAALFVQAFSLGRDLVNTPTCDMSPADLGFVASNLATAAGATYKEIIGNDLLEQNYPLIHAVGRAADASAAPRLIDMRWGDEKNPLVTLVGKGVCYDTGGLDIKPSSAMSLMKKDMGGAATALSLATLIMGANLPVRLRVLIPAVENAIAGNAYRAGDVYPSRKGLTVEVKDTDAEGRLILADALAEADSESPDFLLDFATLTGAARAAVGPELAACFTPCDVLYAEVEKASQMTADPVWRLPLWEGYAKGLESKIADLKNISDDSFAGASIAALFLKNFIEKSRNWVHFDIYAWNPKERPAHPFGGEVMPVLAMFHLLKERYHD
jgi:leucyl aminopeptidase